MKQAIKNTPKRCVLLGAALALLALPQSGCIVGALIGGMAQSYREATPVTVEAEYDGLQGKTVAVVVAADRRVQSEFPNIQREITARINAAFEKNRVAAGYSETDELVAYLSDRPDWPVRPLSDLARELGVERLLFIEVYEFRLHEPGNRYLWDGIAAANVGVIEIEGPLPDQFAFRRQVQVTFPDAVGQGPLEISGQAVASVLLQRFCDRTAWLFYKHDEPYKITY